MRRLGRPRDDQGDVPLRVISLGRVLPRFDERHRVDGAADNVTDALNRTGERKRLGNGGALVLVFFDAVQEHASVSRHGGYINREIDALAPPRELALSVEVRLLRKLAR